MVVEVFIEILSLMDGFLFWMYEKDGRRNLDGKQFINGSGLFVGGCDKFTF